MRHLCAGCSPVAEECCWYPEVLVSRLSGLPFILPFCLTTKCISHAALNFTLSPPFCRRSLPKELCLLNHLRANSFQSSHSHSFCRQCQPWKLPCYPSPAPASSEQWPSLGSSLLPKMPIWAACPQQKCKSRRSSVRGSASCTISSCSSQAISFSLSSCLRLSLILQFLTSFTMICAWLPSQNDFWVTTIRCLRSHRILTKTFLPLHKLVMYSEQCFSALCFFRYWLWSS